MLSNNFFNENKSVFIMTDLSFFFIDFFAIKKKRERQQQRNALSLHKKRLLKLNWA